MFDCEVEKQEKQMDKNNGKGIQSDALVLFGVTGDLAHKMIFPALYAMTKRGALTVPVIGVALPKWTLVQLHARVKDSLQKAGGIDEPKALDQLLSLLRACKRITPHFTKTDLVISAA